MPTDSSCAGAREVVQIYCILAVVLVGKAFLNGFQTLTCVRLCFTLKPHGVGKSSIIGLDDLLHQAPRLLDLLTPNSKKRWQRHADKSASLCKISAAILEQQEDLSFHLQGNWLQLALTFLSEQMDLTRLFDKANGQDN